ncbi:MAG TPA: hypothetical protein VHS97_23935 [Isosphaeraceae bacterium]|nr:hypothetical protein [Isosphaeraceae bacterium]
MTKRLANCRSRMEKLGAGRLPGRFFAASRAKLWEIGECLGVWYMVNLAGCPMR